MEKTLSKARQKRLRCEDEDNEGILPNTKRREHDFSGSELQNEQFTDRGLPYGAGEPHYSESASSSTSCLNTSPVAGCTAPHLGPPPSPHASTDITAALHNTHLDHQRYYSSHGGLPAPLHHHQHQQHPLLLKDAGVPPLPLLQRPSLGPLPDLVHETSESYYCHMNRLLRSAHFERLKRVPVSDGQPGCL